ncbi:glycosyltransferase family 2 protein [Polynucleobacter sp. MWH-Creno-3A4]|uniref:glycosyltransferase family A protein n=1 Tax=Polynucleobacter sp. MWH-Creno-3A4 TaxID=1855886 RepID=UPI001C0BE27F|nr:glycosyltransferase family A protein [Polynucleobacter sp. MWH-Creno-3A4]MBU3606135.1 glycosyltransferase family 2 protein [Polynucleobacter sp. MWH-Creno-3A4]
MSISFSILICTKNSQRLLAKVFDSIFEQSSFHLVQQIIIVDYESNDSTKELARDYCVQAKFNDLLILSCPLPGKGAALVMGLNNVRAKYCIVVDDDNILFPDFIEKAASYLIAKPLIGCIGSRGELDAKLYSPDWFRSHMGAYAIGLPENHEKLDWVWGACSIINMDAWNRLQSSDFHFLLNPERVNSSTPIDIGGEDVELSLAIRMIGYRVVWLNELRFIHSFQQSRLSEAYFLKNNLGVCRSAPIHSMYRLLTYKRDDRLPFLKWSFGVFKNLIGSILRICKYAFAGNIFECQFHWTVFKGILGGYLVSAPRFGKIFNSLRALKSRSEITSRELF